MTTIQEEWVAEVVTENRDTLCSVRIVLVLFKWLRWPKIRWGCERRAEWVAINMCCGSSSYSCDMHYQIAIKTHKGITINCPKCGAQNIGLEWFKLTEGMK